MRTRTLQAFFFHSIAYADDGYIKAKLSVALQVLAELKRVLKEDAGLELAVSPSLALREVNLSIPVNVSQFRNASAHGLEVSKHVRQGLAGGNSIPPFDATSIVARGTSTENI